MFQLLAATPKKRRRRKPLPPNTFRVFFESEAPSIGSGWRLVQLTSLGRKWARCRALTTGRTARLPKAVWEQITLYATKLS